MQAIKKKVLYCSLKYYNHQHCKNITLDTCFIHKENAELQIKLSVLTCRKLFFSCFPYERKSEFDNLNV